jgi:protein gp37
MATKSSIEWTDYTWNPITGCTKVSPGCLNCYAERMTKRLQGMGQSNYANGFELTIHEKSLEIPFRWKRPSMVFVNSMSDLFHERVPLAFINKVFAIIRSTSHHRYQVLTKRAERLAELDQYLEWPQNLWMGVSVENADYQYRIDCLRKTSAKIKFVSIEPMIGPIPQLKLKAIDWVILGGESGPGARPIRIEWVKDVKDQCILNGIPFFFKQWGGKNKKKSGRKLEGRIWSQMPKCLAAAGF